MGPTRLDAALAIAAAETEAMAAAVAAATVGLTDSGIRLSQKWQQHTSSSVAAGYLSEYESSLPATGGKSLASQQTLL